MIEDVDGETGGEPPCYLDQVDENGLIREIEIRLEPARGPHSGRGRQVLVDRIWPRGVSKAALGPHLWLRDVAPSAGLRRWFGHRPERWEEFQARYRAELAEPVPASALGELEAIALAGPLTLLFGAADRSHNQAVALRQVLLERLR